ncbi:hypothetical protein BH09PSE1_BH09PSE1_07850 [soil metagenome]
MADATTAAKDRIDRALAALERKMLDLKARPASAAPIADDDLFARAPGDTGGSDAGAKARIADLETAGRDASDALARAAEQLRGLLSPVQAETD